jgi:hypothetical protein
MDGYDLFDLNPGQTPEEANRESLDRIEQELSRLGQQLTDRQRAYFLRHGTFGPKRVAPPPESKKTPPRGNKYGGKS